MIMDTATIFNRVLFSSHMEEIHDDFKRDIEEAGLSDHQVYQQLHAFDRLVREKIDGCGVKPSALANFVEEMLENKRIHEISGLNDANVFTDIKDFLKRAVEILEDSSLIGDIVPPKTLESIFPTDEELRVHVAYFGEYCDGYTASDEADIQNESENVVEFFSGKSWKQIAMADETEIMRNTDWSDFDWNAWKHVREIGASEANHPSRFAGIFRDEEIAVIAAGAPKNVDLKKAAEAVSKKSAEPSLK